MASSTSSPSLPPYSTVDPQTVQLFARSAQLELLDFVRSMIEQRQLRDPMGGRAKAGDKFMVEVDQFVIGLREPQFEKCGSYDSFGDRVYMKAYRHKLDRVVRCKENISRVRLLSPSWERAGARAGTHEGTRPITSNYNDTLLTRAAKRPDF
ncbi:hypothetical protein BJV78DRAFT_1154066 [Lactifluus subvellereus]|nr:hypothetical protein BJV78DRAFT_1154066 [Lactifluus subvellereus]